MVLFRDLRKGEKFKLSKDGLNIYRKDAIDNAHLVHKNHFFNIGLGSEHPTYPLSKTKGSQ